MHKSTEYLDERQQIERGKAFRAAFFTMLAALIVCCTIDWVSIKPVLGYFGIMMIPIWISFSVIFTLAIMHDALFISNKENQAASWLTLAICWGVTGFIILATSIIGLLRPNNESENMSIAQAVMGACMIEVSIVYFFKRTRDAKKAKTEEEA